MLCSGHVSGQLGWTPWGEGFLLFLIIWFSPIHTRMIHPLGAGYSGGKKCKVCCLGDLWYISNTLYMCTTLQQHCGISLLYEQGYTAEVLGKTVLQLGFRFRFLLIKHNLAKIDLLFFFKVIFFPLLSGNIHMRHLMNDSMYLALVIWCDRSRDARPSYCYTLLDPIPSIFTWENTSNR